MSATESIARRYAAAIGFAVVGELTRKPEWDGVASGPEIGLSGYCRVWMRAVTPTTFTVRNALSLTRKA